MSTPSIAVPGRAPGALDGGGEHKAPTFLRRIVRGREADPVWSRPLLWLIALLAGALTFWGLTRNGYANTYYAEAAQAASHSWTAWFTNALDVSGSDSLDKGPLPNMLMGLSGRLFGFSSFSMLLPEALCGIASVLLLHDAVRRSLGHSAAILAASMLALTPIFVAMSRFNNPDALLVLTEIGAAWALVRALESGRTRPLLLCGLLVGLAFNVKMLEAYLIVPALTLTFLIAGQGRLRRRVGQLAAGGAAMIATSFAWYGPMMLLPASDRPWVGDTTDDSWFTLIFGANGVSRVSGNSGNAGPGGGSGFGGAAGPLRLFDSIVGGQIAWLLPLALAGLVLGLWARRRAPRTDRARSAYLLWGGCGVVSWIVFSFSKGVFHPYYTTALAPAAAVLAAGGLVLAWDRSRDSGMWAAALAVAVLGTAVLAAELLARTGGFVPWLGPLAIVLAALAGIALLLPWAGRESSRRLSAPLRGRLRSFAVVLGVIAVLAGPASYSLATVGKSLTGSNPLAGPVTASTGMGGGPGGAPGGPNLHGAHTGAPSSGGLPGAPPSGRSPSGVPSGGASRGAGGGMGGSVSKATTAYLEAHQGSARYLAAAVGSSAAGSLALETGRNVINIGGFMGSDPSPTLGQLKHLISSGQLHYILLSGGQGGGVGGIGGPGGSSAATQARDSWIKSHGTLVKLSGTSSGGSTLYYLASAV